MYEHDSSNNSVVLSKGIKLVTWRELVTFGMETKLSWLEVSLTRFVDLELGKVSEGSITDVEIISDVVFKIGVLVIPFVEKLLLKLGDIDNEGGLVVLVGGFKSSVDELSDDDTVFVASLIVDKESVERSTLSFKEFISEIFVVLIWILVANGWIEVVLFENIAYVLLLGSSFVVVVGDDDVAEMKIKILWIF